MKARPGFADQFGESLAMSRTYLRAYWISGFLASGLAMLVTGFVPLLILGSAAVVISSLWIFPGALLINFAGLCWFPSRAWDADSPRPFVAGLVSLLLVWGSPFMILKFQIEPPAVLIAAVGHDMAWLAHAIGFMIVGSSLSVASSWALSPSNVEALR